MGCTLAEIGCFLAITDRTIFGMIELWNIRHKMPIRMHEKRHFHILKNGGQYVMIIDISRFRSSVETCKYEGKSLNLIQRFKIKDLSFENGALVISTRKGPLRLAARP